MDVARARWSSSSFLLYAGAFVVLSAALALLTWLEGEHSEGAFFGWAALVFAVLTVVALGFEAAGERVTAGLFAFVSLFMFSVWVGSFEDLIGILDTGEGPFEGFRWGLLLLDIVIIIASLILLARFRFPLLVLPVAFVSWFFLVDLVSGGGDWSAVVSIIVGFFLLLIGTGADRAYGFWLHFVAAFAIGGAFLYMWHSSAWEWILIGLIALFYFLLAGALDRSIYAVLGAIGLFLAWTYFVQRWTDAEVSTPLEGDVGFSSGPNIWGATLLYALFGLFLVAVGLWLERRRAPEALEPTAV